jgi:hypothetical protein
VRSLGYVGNYLKEYESASQLQSSAIASTLSNDALVSVTACHALGCAMQSVLHASHKCLYSHNRAFGLQNMLCTSVRRQAAVAKMLHALTRPSILNTCIRFLHNQIEAIAKPGGSATLRSNSSSTYVSKSDRRLDTNQVPSNESQTAAVLGLGGGLDIVHGTYCV